MLRKKISFEKGIDTFDRFYAMWSIFTRETNIVATCSPVHQVSFAKGLFLKGCLRQFSCPDIPDFCCMMPLTESAIGLL